jgi:hypothetical protein
MGMMRLTKGVDQEDKIITLLVKLNLMFHHLEVVAPEEYLEWVQKVEKMFTVYVMVVKLNLISTSILMKRSVRCLGWSLPFMLWWENLKFHRRRDDEEDITT